MVQRARHFHHLHAAWRPGPESSKNLEIWVDLQDVRRHCTPEQPSAGWSITRASHNSLLLQVLWSVWVTLHDHPPVLLFSRPPLQADLPCIPSLTQLLAGNWLDSWPSVLCHSGFNRNGIVNTAITGICQHHTLVFPYWYSDPHLARAFLSHCH